MMYKERTVALMLKVENIRFGYVPSVDIFRNVTFTIEGANILPSVVAMVVVKRLLLVCSLVLKGRATVACTIMVRILRLCRHLNGVNLLVMYSNNQIAKCSDQQ